MRSTEELAKYATFSLSSSTDRREYLRVQQTFNVHYRYRKICFTRAWRPSRSIHVSGPQVGGLSFAGVAGLFFFLMLFAALHRGLHFDGCCSISAFTFVTVKNTLEIICLSICFWCYKVERFQNKTKQFNFFQNCSTYFPTSAQSSFEYTSFFV